MSLYPKLDNFNTEHIQNSVELDKKVHHQHATEAKSEDINHTKYLYPSINEFMGLELTKEIIAENCSEYESTYGDCHSFVNNSSNYKSYSKIRETKEILLKKDSNGKIGIRVEAINEGVFICIVVRNSPADKAGLHFGDQILSINNIVVQGLSADKIHTLIKNSINETIIITIRNKPFQKTFIIIKDASGQIGINFHNSKIISITNNSPAAKCGLLVNHNLIDINGTSLIGLKDKDIIKLIQSFDSVLKLTVIPSFIYEHMIRKISPSFIREKMTSGA